MPEGDTIYKTAQTLHRVLAGTTVTGFRSVFPALTRVDVDRPLIGRHVESVRSVGKHLLIAFSSDLILHTHMRMHGSWHLYRLGERWQRPARDMRIAIDTDRAVAVAFTVPVAEFLTSADLARHEAIQALGPDLTDPAFDAAEVIRRMTGRGDEQIHDTLLNQRVVSGIGNVFKSEVLFESGVNPFLTTSSIAEATLRNILAVARKQMTMSTGTRDASLSSATGRRTTGSLDPNEKLWVYGRGGKPCRRCGTPIRSKQTGLDARLTYWCPRCQDTI
jgi:endonuclease-8